MASIPIVGTVNPDGTVTYKDDDEEVVVKTTGSVADRLDQTADALFTMTDRLNALALGLPVCERTGILTAVCDVRSAAIRCYGVAECLRAGPA